MRIERSKDSTCKLCHFMNIFIDHNASMKTLYMYMSVFNITKNTIYRYF